MLTLSHTRSFRPLARSEENVQMKVRVTHYGSISQGNLALNFRKVGNCLTEAAIKYVEIVEEFTGNLTELETNSAPRRHSPQAVYGLSR